jgi:hypothetical protein
MRLEQDKREHEATGIAVRQLNTLAEAFIDLGIWPQYVAKFRELAEALERSEARVGRRL